jgi:hydroxyacylglutathione hydrolase
MIKIETVNCLKDNYSYIIQDSESGLIGVVDPSEFHAVDKVLRKKFKRLDYILNTHHHLDHVGGNQKLKNKYGSKIIGAKIDKDRIPAIDLLLNENEIFKFGAIKFKVISLPGHTTGHIAFYSKQENIIFTGDTLFSLGCGRIFEGTPNQMFSSLNKIKKLPKNTKIYFGHEYTKNNFNFCLNYEKNNKALENKIKWIDSRLKKGLFTTPTLLEDELNTNIFLRCENNAIKKNLGMNEMPDELIFEKLRNLKDNF